MLAQRLQSVPMALSLEDNQNCFEPFGSGKEHIIF